MNRENRDDFVNRFIRFDVEMQAKARCDAFWNGFSRFVDPEMLIELFSIGELPTLISGQ